MSEESAVEKTVSCPHCNKKGFEPADEGTVWPDDFLRPKCSLCKGKGVVPVPVSAA